MDYIVIDFTGFDFQDHCIIKEFAVARITGTTIEVDDQILVDTTELQISAELLNSSRKFQLFYDNSSIAIDKRSDYTRDDLVAKLDSFRNESVYVRDKAFGDILNRYTRNEFTSYKSLAALGFDPEEHTMKTYCDNHRNRKSYCAKNNVMNMAEWLKEKLKDVLDLKKKFAVIDFVGHQSPDDQSRTVIEKLRVCCTDNFGSIVVNRLLFVSTCRSVRVSTDDLDNYRRSYRGEHGIDHSPTNAAIMALRNQLTRILISNKISFIFVESSGHKNALIELIGPGLTIIALEDFGYRNECEGQGDRLDHGVKSIVSWVIKKILNGILSQRNDQIEETGEEGMQQNEVIEISDEEEL